VPAHRSAEGDRGLFVPVAFGAVALAILVGGTMLGLELAGLLLAAAALGLVLIRMARALAENRALLGASRTEASTDPLTGLGNRRRLGEDLSNILAASSEESPVALVILDLNGFKTYNDSFGHAAGDMLLTQLGASLSAAVQGRGEAYRLGGDEFCVLAPCPDREPELLSSAAARALATRGEGFSITAAHGLVMLPSEAQDPSSALALADARMYGNKATAGRPQAAGELTRVLTAVLEERAPTLAEHSKTVSEFALATALRLDLGEDELEAIRHAARLVRSSHERVDGTGYPDGLHGDEIPVAARIIAVADAFGAMTAPRPYKPILTIPEALAELQRCAGTQFDPEVTAAFQDAFVNPRLAWAA
jgi:two-component system, cell cycle response regulator